MQDIDKRRDELIRRIERLYELIADNTVSVIQTRRMMGKLHAAEDALYGLEHARRLEEDRAVAASGSNEMHVTPGRE